MSDMVPQEGYFRVEIPEGAHLATSRSNPDAYRGLSQDDQTNALGANVNLFKVDADEVETLSASDGEIADAVAKVVSGIVVGVAATVIAQQCAPRVNSWWKGRVLPALKRRPSAEAEATEEQSALMIEAPNFSHDHFFLIAKT